MTQIKAAFFDIDGTLLPFHAKALPESTVQALAALRKNGVKTFIATGRPPVHLPYLHALDGIPFDGYVTMNGQYCYLADGELLYTKYIPAASLQTLLPYIEKEQLSVGFVGKDFCRFNLINDLSRDFAKKLELGAGDVAALITSLARSCRRRRRPSSCAAAPAAWLCAGRMIFAISYPRAAASPTAWPTR